jgi:hypothetical protein
MSIPARVSTSWTRLTPRRRGRQRNIARIAHDGGLALCRAKIDWAGWAVLIEPDRMVLKSGGRNPVRLGCGALG